MPDKKKRAKREIVVLTQDGDQYATTEVEFKTTAEAKKWIRNNGEALADKTLRIASLAEPMTIRVETVSKVRWE